MKGAAVDFLGAALVSSQACDRHRLAISRALRHVPRDEPRRPGGEQAGSSGCAPRALATSASAPSQGRRHALRRWSGMVMRVDCLVACLESLDEDREGGVRAHRVLLTPQGRPLSQSLLRRAGRAARHHAGVRAVRGLRRSRDGLSSTRRSRWAISCSPAVKWRPWRSSRRACASLARCSGQ